MKKNIFYVVFVGTILAGLFSCEPDSQSEAEEKGVEKVPFEMAQNYFVKNTVMDQSVRKILFTSQNEFGEYFGMAGTMGENGKSTPIDFSVQNVLAIIGEKTDKDVVFQVKSLTHQSDSVFLSYTFEEGETRSFTIRPFVLILFKKEFGAKYKTERL